MKIKKLLERAEHNFEEGFLEEAIADFNEVIELDPTCWDAYESRGVVYRELDLNDNKNHNLKSPLKELYFATCDLERAIDLTDNPETKAMLHIELSYINSVYGEFCDSAINASIAISLNPNNAIGYTRRAISLLGLEDYDGSLADAKKALEIEPNQPEALILVKAMNPIQKEESYLQNIVLKNEINL
tara:strand:+ start:212 stop:772 length:561 start_codon:yes stop_codon:yes gene_type:complete